MDERETQKTKKIFWVWTPQKNRKHSKKRFFVKKTAFGGELRDQSRGVLVLRDFEYDGTLVFSKMSILKKKNFFWKKMKIGGFFSVKNRKFECRMVEKRKVCYMDRRVEHLRIGESRKKKFFFQKS